MEITYSSVPGGELHVVTTRNGDHFRLLVERSGARSITILEPTDPDTVLAILNVEPDEAEMLADLLHSRSIPDRIAELERRLAKLSQPRGGSGQMS